MSLMLSIPLFLFCFLLVGSGAHSARFTPSVRASAEVLRIRSQTVTRPDKGEPPPAAPQGLGGQESAKGR